MNTEISFQKIYFIIKILSVFGVLLAVYLLWEQYTKPLVPPCTINSYINCNAIISGPVANTFGIPTPLYGLIGYIVIFFAALLKKNKILFFMATFGLVFCLWIAYQEIVLLRVICPVCIGCQLIMATIFLLSIKMLFFKKR